MITSGAQGLYRRRASDKLRWNGIPEHAIPSFFTSCTCPRHSRVDRQQRRGDRFLCPDCGGPEHADTHAAYTIACYLLLTPIAGAGSAAVRNPPPRDGRNQTFDPASPAEGEDTALQEALSLNGE
jgi:transposase